MELNAKVAHQVWVFDTLKYLQLICRLLDCFVVIGLKADLFKTKENNEKLCAAPACAALHLSRSES